MAGSIILFTEAPAILAMPLHLPCQIRMDQAWRFLKSGASHVCSLRAVVTPIIFHCPGRVVIDKTQ
jgi:hypothetical protein